jgi:dihydrofolate reductase
MRKIVFSIGMTLDGFFDHTAMIADEALHEYATALLREADVLLFGRVMYQLLADYWPTAAQDPSLPAGVVEYANQLNPMPKIVYSKTLETVGWNTTLVRAIVPEEIEAMKRQPGRDIAVAGGANLMSTFMNLGLIDEFRLLVNPIVLGSGRPLFEKVSSRHDLKLVGTNTFTSGTVELHYSKTS